MRRGLWLDRLGQEGHSRYLKARLGGDNGASKLDLWQSGVSGQDATGHVMRDARQSSNVECLSG